MIKNRTTQLVWLSMACTFGLLGVVASFGTFNYAFRWDFYVHFTNLSNYFCVGMLFAELIQTIRKKENSYVSVCPLAKFMGVLAILLTFCVFNIMLAPTRAMEMNFAINSVLFHILIPVIFVADWFLFYERKKVTWKYPLISVCFPLIYIVFILIHAACLGFDSSILIPGTSTPLIYPYFFLNPETQGIGGVVQWVVILFAAFAAIGFVFFGLDRIGKKAK